GLVGLDGGEEGQHGQGERARRDAHQPLYRTCHLCYAPNSVLNNGRGPCWGRILMFRSYYGPVLILLAVLPAQAAHAADDELKRYEFSEPHMGTKFGIVVYAKDEATAKAGAKAAFARVAELNGIMSDYDSTSELMRLCAKAGGEP